MARGESLKLQKKPKNYRAPDWAHVDEHLRQVRADRQAVIDRIWAVKKARRNDWNDVIGKLPAAYRKMPMVLGEPDIPEMIQRVSGLVSKHTPLIQVLPPTGRRADVDKAAKEEARLMGLIETIQDQQDRDTWAMAIDSQLGWGESWIGVYIDPDAIDDEYERGKDETGAEYAKRYERLMAQGGVPLRLVDHDPQTVFPIKGDKERLVAAIIQTEHREHELSSGFGYKAVRGDDGKTIRWDRITLGEPFPTEEGRSGSRLSTDTNHDSPVPALDAPVGSGKMVKKTIWLDRWTVRTFLDGKLVEEWPHGYGCVPLFPAFGKETSDRDPAWASQGIADVALTVARQMVFFAAMLASNASLHGFPTPFLKNPEHGLVHPVTGEPLTRSIHLGEMNPLGVGEEIIFPFLDAKMLPDFFRVLDMLQGKLDASALGSFNKAIDADVAGYAIAQVRSMQMAVIGIAQRNVQRQWRKMAYFFRHVVKTDFPEGVYLRGAIEENEEGERFQPIMEYASKHCTDFSIDIVIPEGIKQDEMAERKSAIEMYQAGLWSQRRAMEKSGVEDPAAEADEIGQDRILASPASDQLILSMAAEITQNRIAAMQKSNQTGPFAEAVERAKQTFAGSGGMPQPQGGEPGNALAGGQPADQNPVPNAPQQTGGAKPGQGGGLETMGATQMPGGVAGAQQVPAGAPG